ncbi:unnamed protein product [Lactuca virosa]|uniref:Uncharacterized protein n=1 Tax=Lactuca virosa TaxID=75947 RepID=A0AAU9NZB5_9ASTR|nr:unnamed protein product [Lactuca virosa]
MRLREEVDLTSFDERENRKTSVSWSRIYIATEFVTLRSMRELTEDWYFLTAKTTLGCSRLNLILEFSVIDSCLLTFNNISQLSRFSTPFGDQKGLRSANKLPIA